MCLLNERSVPQTLLMDYRIPLQNGLETARRIRQVDYSISVIMATGDEAAKESIIEAGFDYLQKPFSISDLRIHLEKN